MFHDVARWCMNYSPSLALTTAISSVTRTAFLEVNASASASRGPSHYGLIW